MENRLAGLIGGDGQTGAVTSPCSGIRRASSAQFPSPDRHAADLLRELWAAGYAIERPNVDLLQALGVTGLNIVNAGWVSAGPPISAMKIETSGGLFQPSEAGRQAFVMPVAEYRNIVDIVAWVPTDPSRLWLRSGYGAALGVDQIENSTMFLGLVSSPLMLHPTPLAWLCNGCQGVCILDWPRTRLILAGVTQFLCSDPALAKRLTRALQCPPDSFEIRLTDQVSHGT